MKKIGYILLIILLQLLNQSCTKQIAQPTPVSALTIVNAIVGANPFIVDYSGNANVSTYYSTTRQVGYGSFYQYSLPSGSIPITIYQTTDTINSVFKNRLNLQPQGIYSFFLSGTNPANPDTLLMQNIPPYHAASDSTMGIRFVNLSPGSNPISVNIKGNAYGSEVNVLPYKSITVFKNYATTYKISSYVLEFRDMATGNLITSYTINGVNNGTGTNTSNNSWRFRNFTIVLKGLPGGTGSTAQGTFLVNNY